MPRKKGGNQKKRQSLQEIADELILKDEKELGACSTCSRHHVNGAYGTGPDGEIMISCLEVHECVPAQVNLRPDEKCKYLK